MKASDRTPARSSAVAGSLLLRAAGFAILWWVLAEGRLEDPWVIAVCLGAALAVSAWISPIRPGVWRPLGILRFVPCFLIWSVQGGIDVARRAFHPAMPLRPEILTWTLRGSRRQSILLAWIVSLLPGTAAVSLENGMLRIHVLDSRLPVRKTLRDLERRVAAICD